MIDLTKEERFQYPNTDEARAQIMKDYYEIIDEINKNIGKMFNVQPMEKIEVRRIPEFKEKDAPVAFGNPASLDGVRPAAVQVNLRMPSDVFNFGTRTLAYNEAIPGHAFHLTVAQKIKGLP